MTQFASYLWQPLAEPGSGYCAIRRTDQNVYFDGSVLAVLNGRPLRVEYQIKCTADWRTRRVDVRTWLGAGGNHLTLTINERQRWWLHRRELERVRGCIDVDLGVTPATNTLPIRRLNLAVGESRAVTAAWMRFPELVIEPLPQRYTRLSENKYRYESREGAFTAELTVDEMGVVTHYEGSWECVAQYPGEGQP